MPVRKYRSEFGLDISLNGMWLLQLEHLNDLENEDSFKNNPAHIYLVARQPKVSFESFHQENELIKFKFKIKVQDSCEEVDLTFPVKSGETELNLYSSYPKTKFSLNDKQDNMHLAGKSALLLLRLIHSCKEINCFSIHQLVYYDYLLAKLLSFEVLYIGQAYGKEGPRTVIQRLKDHSTVQTICHDTLSNCPDMDIWIIPFSFEVSEFMIIDSKRTQYETSVKEDKEHFYKAFNTRITKKQLINLFEVSLIQHFKPKYNIHLKKPSNSTNKTLSEFYELDINAAIIHLSTKPLECMLRFPLSKYFEAGYEYDIKFHFHSLNERNSIFDLSDEVIIRD